MKSPIPSRDSTNRSEPAYGLGVGDAVSELVGRLADKFLEIPRPAKRAIAVALDAGLCIFVTVLAYYLRLGDWVALDGNRWIPVIVSITLSIPLFAVSGLYRAIFRYSDNASIILVGKAILVYGVIYAGLFTFAQFDSVPRTIGIIQPILLFIFVASSRILVSWVLGGQYMRRLQGEEQRTVLIYGAGSSGRQLAAAIIGSREMHVAGFIDDDPTLQGSIISGRRIYASLTLARIVARAGVTDILLAVPSATKERRVEIVEMLRPLGVRVQTIPGLMDLASGKVQVSALRALEIEDLLGRDVASPNEILFARNILGKTVLVTGAGGSIGSELCRQIVAARPERLLLIDFSEFGLYAINSELRRLLPEDSLIEIVPLLASARDAPRLRAIMDTWRPHTVYHAAAYKHVPLVEHNPAEGVANNVFGTLTMARVAIEAGVGDFVLISTDKAVRPTNVMGATKRLAELCLQALSAEGTATRFSMVRFGNVLGSSGSVVPLFREQIAAGGPVTITHAEVTRYFMTIPEAAQLVIQAGAMASGGEVFILDMGEPVRISDLARKMIELSGMTVCDADNPEGEIEIQTIGLRPGEKLYEELLIGDNPKSTSHPLIMKAVEGHIPLAQLETMLDQLNVATRDADVHEIRDILRTAVPEFAPTGDVVDWVHLGQAG